MSGLAIMDMVYLQKGLSARCLSREKSKICGVWGVNKMDKTYEGVTGAGYLLKKAWTSALAYRYPLWVKISVNGVIK